MKFFTICLLRINQKLLEVIKRLATFLDSSNDFQNNQITSFLLHRLGRFGFRGFSRFGLLELARPSSLVVTNSDSESVSG